MVVPRHGGRRIVQLTGMLTVHGCPPSPNIREQVLDSFSRFGRIVSVTLQTETRVVIQFEERSAAVECVFGGPHYVDGKCVTVSRRVRNMNNDQPVVPKLPAKIKKKGYADVPLEIFIQNINQRIKPEQLIAYLSEFDTPTRILMPLRNSGKKHRNYAYVSFSSQEVVDKLIGTRHRIRGREFQIQPSKCLQWRTDHRRWKEKLLQTRASVRAMAKKRRSANLPVDLQPPKKKRQRKRKNKKQMQVIDLTVEENQQQAEWPCESQYNNIQVVDLTKEASPEPAISSSTKHQRRLIEQEINEMQVKDLGIDTKEGSVVNYKHGSTISHDEVMPYTWVDQNANRGRYVPLFPKRHHTKSASQDWTGLNKSHLDNFHFDDFDFDEHLRHHA